MSVRHFDTDELASILTVCANAPGYRNTEAYNKLALQIAKISAGNTLAYNRRYPSEDSAAPSSVLDIIRADRRATRGSMVWRAGLGCIRDLHGNVEGEAEALALINRLGLGEAIISVDFEKNK